VLGKFCSLSQSGSRPGELDWKRNRPLRAYRKML